MPFNDLEIRRQEIIAYTASHAAFDFFLQECRRFISIAGTLTAPGSGFKLDTTAGIDERYITHPLLRTLLENYFTILWLFDDTSKIGNRYDMILSGFAHDYSKYWTDMQKPDWKPFMAKYGALLPNSATLVVSGQKGLPVSSMLDQITNSVSTRPTYLYPLYRITSFDVHGKSLSNVIENSFGRTGINFPVLDLTLAIDNIADEYIEILDNLKGQKLIT